MMAPGLGFDQEKGVFLPFFDDLVPKTGFLSLLMRQGPSFLWVPEEMIYQETLLRAHPAVDQSEIKLFDPPFPEGF
jgi:hypothetical protein